LAGTSNESVVVDDGNFWQFQWLGYFFGNFRDKGQQYYMTICYPLLACDWFQNEWLRM